MIPLLNTALIVTLLVIGICIWQVAQIVKKEKTSDEVDPKEVKRLERRLNVIHICVYVLVVIAVFRIYMMIAA
jgi:heme/copper-type cytochrome/quinol oxidase subunit 2